MPNRIRGLLDYLVDHYVVRDEQRDIDLNARVREPSEVIEADKRQAATREGMRADELADPFRLGLVAAYRARLAGGEEVSLDDRRPNEDRMADALIHFLVRFDLASSRTEETEPMKYVYHVAVDWPRLGEVARRAGIDLDDTLRELAAGAAPR